ncbi:MAG: BrnT family toxin [Deltaproteobacteria bacterium]|nr:MAG: BrnT family toxin [Deltaproteobacteria bacterium]
MKFEWDEAKRRINFEKHGLDFRDAEKVFEGPIITVEDGRYDYGETRLISLGLLADVVVVIVHTVRHEKTRIISMRKAKAREKKAYEEKILLGSETPPEPQG